METRIDRMEAEADLVNPKTKPSLEDEFAQLSTDEEIEKELASLKGKAYDAKTSDKQND